MKILNSKIVQVLQQLNNINKMVIMDYPYTGMASEGNSTLAFFDTSKLGEQQFDTYGILDINELISAINLLEEPTIELEDDVITISNSSTQLQYLTTDTSILAKSSVEAKHLNLTKQAETVASFDISSKELSSLKKASDVFRTLENFVIKCTDKIELQINTSNKRAKKSNYYSKEIPGEFTKEFEIDMQVKDLKYIPAGDYHVNVKYSDKKDTYRVLFTSKTIDSLELIVNVKK